MFLVSNEAVQSSPQRQRPPVPGLTTRSGIWKLELRERLMVHVVDGHAAEIGFGVAPVSLYLTRLGPRRDIRHNVNFTNHDARVSPDVLEPSSEPKNSSH